VTRAGAWNHSGKTGSSPGQAVYDPFVGSGTTIIAAEMTGRCCHAIELRPAYVDVAIMRWQNFTGLTATLEATGEAFEAKDRRGACSRTQTRIASQERPVSPLGIAEDISATHGIVFLMQFPGGSDKQAAGEPDPRRQQAMPNQECRLGRPHHTCVAGVSMA